MDNRIVESLKKVYCFFVIAFYAVGLIGGFGYAIYSKAYFIAFCVVALGVMGFPYVKTAFSELLR